jgi:hypothetical protein
LVIWVNYFNVFGCFNKATSKQQKLLFYSFAEASTAFVERQKKQAFINQPVTGVISGPLVIYHIRFINNG